MTRQEEIADAADRIFTTTEYYIPTMEVLGFTFGAEWADAHPKSPWISIEDDLPCNHEDLISTNKETIHVITIDKYGIIEENYMVLYDNGKWEWKHSAPCYWMPIPKLPKIGD